jgi:uncharacterized membrane protein YdbT with pleckstrin-like domain
MEKKIPFDLIEDEKIVKEIKPLPQLKWYWFAFYSFIPIMTILFFGFLIAINLILEAHGELDWYIFAKIFLKIFFGVSIPILFLVLCYSILSYKWEYYWITNKRIIQRKGVLGYEVWSTPLERISDVILSRSFLEKIFGFGSLRIQTLAGQFSEKGYGAEISLRGIQEPESIQKLIFQLIKEKREKEKLAF